MTPKVASVLGRTPPASCLRDPRWRRPVFAVAERSYDWLDVVLAAMAGDGWAHFARDLVAGLACVAEADAAGTWPSTSRLAEAATAFRYGRDLLSGAETAAWLAGSDVSLDAWSDFLARRLLIDDHGPRLESIVARHGAAIEIADDAFSAEGVCSGRFEEFAEHLAGRAAVVAAHGAPVGRASGTTDGAALRATQASWLSALDAGDVSTRLSHLLALHDQFDLAARAATSTHALEAQVAEHRLDWTRIDLEQLSFHTIDAAHEAACLIREDRLTMTDVAIASRQTVVDARVLLEQLAPAWHHALIAASVDDLVGPIAVGSRYELAWLVAKAPPDLDDPIVRVHAEQAVVAQLMSSASLAQVRWIARRPAVLGAP